MILWIRAALGVLYAYFCSAQLSMLHAERRSINTIIIIIIIIIITIIFISIRPPRWPSGKASASRAEDPEFESRLRRDFFGVESYQ